MWSIESLGLRFNVCRQPARIRERHVVRLANVLFSLKHALNAGILGRPPFFEPRGDTLISFRARDRLQSFEPHERSERPSFRI
jgi:hypothetical protein